jgi:hypothetical protein
LLTRDFDGGPLAPVYFLLRKEKNAQQHFSGIYPLSPQIIALENEVAYIAFCGFYVRNDDAHDNLDL